MVQKRVTLSIDDKVYKEFQKFCEDNDIILSKRIERLMNEHINNSKSKKGVKNE